MDRKVRRAERRPDRCFVVPMGDRAVRVRAGRRPRGRTLKALQDLVRAAERYIDGR